MAAAYSTPSCEFDLDSARCLRCACYADCLDESIPIPYEPDAPADGPLRVIVPWCNTRRHRDRRYAS